MSICFYASELAIITGENTYQKLDEFIIKFWQRVKPEDYYSSIKTLEKKNNIIFVPKETDNEVIENISKKNNINIKKELNSALKTNNVEELHKKKKEIIQKFSSVKEQKKVIESLNNILHTNFGTIYENDALKYYENLHNTKVFRSDKFKRRKLFQYKDYNYYIGGKIDGYLEDGTIIEVKNRMYKLFNNLRSYERTQIYGYLYIFDSHKALLLEKLKKSVNSKINIIEVIYNELIFNEIKRKLYNFAQFFDKFLNSSNFKTALLFGNEEIIEELNNYVFNLINKENE